MILTQTIGIRIERRNVYQRGVVNSFGDWYVIRHDCHSLREAREAIAKLRKQTNRDESEFRLIRRKTTEEVVR